MTWSGFATAHPSRGFMISELVQHLGMNIASAHATLAVLCDFGFVVRDPVHRTYVLGPALAATGFAALEQHPAIETSIEQAGVLAAELGAEVGVSATAGRDVISSPDAARNHAPPASAAPTTARRYSPRSGRCLWPGPAKTPWRHGSNAPRSRAPSPTSTGTVAFAGDGGQAGRSGMIE
ncbi:IclR family transcriptional regulator [Frankia nepalensis]|uniref:hypothetical protein n=1 Tax=Frankia nepalensis TaxID=1836974 RepID=UPI001EE453E8|nr:hypothetical protein [Frankia nepalensis]